MEKAASKRICLRIGLRQAGVILDRNAWVARVEVTLVQGSVDALAGFAFAARTLAVLAGRTRRPPLHGSFLGYFFFGLLQVFWFAQVLPRVFVRGEGEDLFILTGQAQVGVDYGERAGFSELGQEAWGNYVDAGEGQGFGIGGGHDFLLGAVWAGAVATESRVIVEEQVAGGFALLRGEGGQGAVVSMKVRHSVQAGGA